MYDSVNGLNPWHKLFIQCDRLGEGSCEKNFHW